MKNNEVIYFDSFGVEYIPKEIMEKIKNKNIKSNIFRIQDNIFFIFWNNQKIKTGNKVKKEKNIINCCIFVKIN